MNLITIDPGVKTGVAVFEKGLLRHCGLLSYDNSQLFGYAIQGIFELSPPGRLVVEVPRIYNRKRWKGDPNDLILNAIIAGICIGKSAEYCIAEEVHVTDWKGQRPKDVDNAYTRKILSGDELAVLHNERIPKSYEHNVVDAIGIGLWKLERR